MTRNEFINLVNSLHGYTKSAAFRLPKINWGGATKTVAKPVVGQINPAVLANKRVPATATGSITPTAKPTSAAKLPVGDVDTVSLPRDIFRSLTVPTAATGALYAGLRSRDYLENVAKETDIAHPAEARENPFALRVFGAPRFRVGYGRPLPDQFNYFNVSNLKLPPDYASDRVIDPLPKPLSNLAVTQYGELRNALDAWKSNARDAGGIPGRSDPELDKQLRDKYVAAWNEYKLKQQSLDAIARTERNSLWLELNPLRPNMNEKFNPPKTGVIPQPRTGGLSKYPIGKRYYLDATATDYVEPDSSIRRSNIYNR